MPSVERAWLKLGLIVLVASCGSPSGSRPGDGAPPVFDLELLAGNIGGDGNADGPGGDARFVYPISTAVDGAGNIYVADALAYTIRKITPAGVVSRLAGAPGISDSVDGTGAAARFGEPWAVAADHDGNVYVADRKNRAVRKVTPDGVVTTLAGATMSGTVGAGAAAQFTGPSGLAVDGAGNVYVADQYSCTLRKVTAAGVVTTIAGSGTACGNVDGQGAAALFSSPMGLAIDNAGNVYVADNGNHSVRKVTAAGAVTTLARTLGDPGSVAVDGAGNVYAVDNDDIVKITPDGVVTVLAGTGGMGGSADGTGSAARFSFPDGVACDSAGNLYVADTGNTTIRKVTATGVVTTLAGDVGVTGSADGTGAAARFFQPAGVAVDSAGNVYVADHYNSTIRKITSAGVVTTLAGAVGMTSNADGPGAVARFDQPYGVATDSADNVYIADAAADTIRKITPAAIVATLAGTRGDGRDMDGMGAAASFGEPTSVVADRAGNLYVVDAQSSTVRKITPAGLVTTLAGSSFLSGSTDGIGAAARFLHPFGVAVDSAGNLYIADTGNSTIRKITAAGLVTTLAGSAGMQGSVDGTGAAARFNEPAAVAIDDADNLYVADTRNATIRQVTPAGVVTTVAGKAGMMGIVLGPAPQLSAPLGLTITGDSLVVSDTNAVLLLRRRTP